VAPKLRTVLTLASTVVFFETVFFTTLAPLLPHYEDSLALSKFEVGILSAAYAAGAFVGAVPAGVLALRWGVRAAVLVGLALLAFGSLLLGFATGASTIDLARFVQGIGSSVAWTGALAWLVTVAPRARRGEVLGVALGAAVAGSLVGPTVGWAAARMGAEATFSLVACLGLVVMVFAWAIPSPAPASGQLTSMARALRSGEAVGGAYLLFFSALLLGALFVLAPLQLGDFGWSAGQIAACFFVDSLITMLASPWLGRWSDRRGRTSPILAGLSASLLASLGLFVVERSWTYALFVVLAGVVFSATWVPGTALLSDGAERADVDIAVGFVLFNLAWTPGFVAGSALGGSGNSLAYLILAISCAATLLGVLFSTRWRRRGAVEITGQTRTR